MHADGRSMSAKSSSDRLREYRTDREVRHQGTGKHCSLYLIPNFRLKSGLQQHPGAISAGMIPCATDNLISATPTGCASFL